MIGEWKWWGNSWKKFLVLFLYIYNFAGKSNIYVHIFSVVKSAHSRTIMGLRLFPFILGDIIIFAMKPSNRVRISKDGNRLAHDGEAQRGVGWGDELREWFKMNIVRGEGNGKCSAKLCATVRKAAIHFNPKVWALDQGNKTESGGNERGMRNRVWWERRGWIKEKEFWKL